MRLALLTCHLPLLWTARELIRLSRFRGPLHFLQSVEKHLEEEVKKAQEVSGSKAPIARSLSERAAGLTSTIAPYARQYEEEAAKARAEVRGRAEKVPYRERLARGKEFDEEERQAVNRARDRALEGAEKEALKLAPELGKLPAAQRENLLLTQITGGGKPDFGKYLIRSADVDIGGLQTKMKMVQDFMRAQTVTSGAGLLPGSPAGAHLENIRGTAQPAILSAESYGERLQLAALREEDLDARNRQRQIELMEKQVGVLESVDAGVKALQDRNAVPAPFGRWGRDD